MHYFILTAIVIFGALLRFCSLGLKPLWSDEVLTALFSLGWGFDRLPTATILSLSQLQQLLTFNPHATWVEISQHLVTESTHPPLFFCLLHSWLGMVQSWDFSLAWQLRVLPALFGVGVIIAIYILNRLAFSRQAALLGAAIMAVSPFAVYLSQEARHYTLPLLLITISLTLLILIQKDLTHSPTLRQQPLLWLAWGLINCLSLYVHYFCFIALVSQLITLLIIIYKFSHVKGKSLLIPLLCFCLPFILYLPWLGIILNHAGSSKTNWLISRDWLAPIYQTVVGWTLMIIALPLEKQPLWLQIPSVFLTIGFVVWFGWELTRRIKILLKLQSLPTLTVLIFSLSTVAQFGVIIYGAGKDISIAPRYNFIYFPGIIALLGAAFSLKIPSGLIPISTIFTPFLRGFLGKESSFSKPDKKMIKFSNWGDSSSLILLLVGLISSLCVVFNLALQKPYYPEGVARQLQESKPPVAVIMGYNDPLEIAVGLSYALALKESEPITFTFLATDNGYDAVWRSLATLPLTPRQLWIIAPGLIQADYPQGLQLKDGVSCAIEPQGFYRIGFPYQLYHCP